MKGEKRSRGFLTPGVVIGALVVGGGLFLSLLLVVYGSRPARTPVGVVTAALTVITIPTSTPTMVPETQEPPSNPDEPPPPPPGELGIGAFVKVSGTEGAGLRLRNNPGLDNEPLYLGMEDEIFKIEDGPIESDGYLWWYLAAPFEPDRNGWAVSNYLEPVQEP